MGFLSNIFGNKEQPIPKYALITEKEKNAKFHIAGKIEYKV